MKYVILCDSNNIEPFIEPRQLAVIGGEILIERTTRLLKENGVKDIVITSHDKRFDNRGAVRYEPQHNDYDPIKKTGYWLNAFPVELLTEPICFLLGDVYYSNDAIKTIVKSETDSTLFFCMDKTKGFSDKYIKLHDEPFGYKVADTELFKEHIEKLKRMFDNHETKRHPIVWELYRSINGYDVNQHILKDNYISINDITCDIDRIDDIMLINEKLGGKCMVKCEVILKEFTLGRFSELKNLTRAKEGSQDGHLYYGDTFECTEDLYKYMAGGNAKNLTVVKLIEVIPEEVKPVEEPKEELKEVPYKETEEKPKRKPRTTKKTSKK